ncbi:MAG: hypothetical protein C4321_06865 [Chloroflexota bacterium]
MALSLLGSAVLLAMATVAAAIAATPTDVPKSPAIPATPAKTASAGYPRYLTLEQLDAYARLAGWPIEPGWWPQMRQIILCENASLDASAFNRSDPNGGSFGLAQLNGSYHFERAGEDFRLWSDPVVNLRTALWVRTVYGRFGGQGGWANCAALLGIH